MLKPFNSKPKSLNENAYLLVESENSDDIDDLKCEPHLRTHSNGRNDSFARQKLWSVWRMHKKNIEKILTKTTSQIGMCLRRVEEEIAASSKYAFAFHSRLMLSHSSMAEAVLFPCFPFLFFFSFVSQAKSHRNVFILPKMYRFSLRIMLTVPFTVTHFLSQFRFLSFLCLSIFLFVAFFVRQMKKSGFDWISGKKNYVQKKNNRRSRASHCQWCWNIRIIICCKLKLMRLHLVLILLSKHMQW